MKRTAITSIRGKTGEWCVIWHCTQEQIDAMNADGIDVGVVYNSFPEWIAVCGLAPVWCFAQDVFNFRNPFHK